jgi:putative dimethyl sulfoxide reductase chaperone
MTTSQQLEILASREHTYRFLAAIFRDAPAPTLIVDLARTLSGRSMNGASRGYERLRAWAGALPAGDEPAAVQVLNMEFARLLLNLDDIPCFYPCESVYTSPECMMKQDAYLKVVAIYREEGLGRLAATGEPEDHVSMEMEFMAHLCVRAQDALANGRREEYSANLEKQRQFLATHLLPWVPRFAGKLKEAAREDFYLAVAEITEEFLRDETANLDELADSGGAS